MVTKLRLTSLAETGTVVGRLSGIGTAGRYRRHRDHRLRPHLPGAGQRDPGRSRRAAGAGRRGGGVADPRTAGGRPPGRAGPGRRADRRGGPRRLRRRDDVPLRGRGGRPAASLRPHPRARRAAALVRGPRRPAPSGVPLHPRDRGGHRHRVPRRPGRCGRTTSVAVGSPCRATWPRPGRAPQSVVSEIDPGVVARRRGAAGLPTRRAGPGAGRGRSARTSPAGRRQPGPDRRRRLRRRQRAVAPDHPRGDRRRRPGADPGGDLRAQPAGLRSRSASPAPRWPPCGSSSVTSP